MQHLAWLHAVPDKQKKSRYQALRDQGSHWLNMPSLDDAQYLMEALTEIGLARANMEPVTFVEIDAWARLTGSDPSPAEASALREASEAYVVQLGKSRQPDCPAPYDSRDVEERRAEVSSSFRQLFKRAQQNG